MSKLVKKLESVAFDSRKSGAIHCNALEGKPIIVFKKVRWEKGKYKGWGTLPRCVLVCLVPPTASRARLNTKHRPSWESSEFGSKSRRFGKFRVSRAFVLAAFKLNGERIYNKKSKFTSIHDSAYRWRLGTWQRPSNKFHPDPADQCSAGLHFYSTLLEARRH